MSDLDADVVVVGGGPAGATTARLLGEAGWTVILLDAQTFPREKPCGEGIMPTGVRLLDQWGLLQKIPEAQRHPIRGVEFVVNETARVRGDFPDMGAGYRTGLGVRRRILDELLLRHAGALPSVAIHEGEPAKDVRRTARGAIEVLTDRSAYRARLVVGADGIRSLVRRKVGLDTARGRRQRFGIRTHFQLPPGTSPGEYVCVEHDVRDQCFTTPVGDSEVQISLLVDKPGMRAFAGRLEPAFQDAVNRRPRLRKLLDGAQRISPILACGPFDTWPSRRTADNVLLVGDAGGYLDPMTGEGISLALQGSVWAAEVIDDGLRSGDLSSRRLRPYDRRVSRALRDYRWLTRALLWVSRHPGLARRVVSRMSRCPDLYSALLAVNCGVRHFADIPMRDWLRFLMAPE